MPKLKQLVCSIELSNSVTPCKEYGTVYEDGIVKTYIAIPRLDTFFAIRLTSEDYIDEGLAMFVYADGVYQCNRNQIGLIPSDGSTPVNLTEIDFRVRQKESHKAEDEWLGRQWRFKPAKLVKSLDAPFEHFAQTGTIQVFVLRCRATKDYRRLPSETANSPRIPRSGVPPKSFILNPQTDDDTSDRSSSSSNDSLVARLAQKIFFTRSRAFSDSSSNSTSSPSVSDPRTNNPTEPSDLFGLYGFDGPSQFSRRSRRSRHNRDRSYDNSDTSEEAPIRTRSRRHSMASHYGRYPTGYYPGVPGQASPPPHYPYGFHASAWPSQHQDFVSAQQAHAPPVTHPSLAGWTFPYQQQPALQPTGPPTYVPSLGGNVFHPPFAQEQSYRPQPLPINSAHHQVPIQQPHASETVYTYIPGPDGHYSYGPILEAASAPGAPPYANAPLYHHQPSVSVQGMPAPDGTRGTSVQGCSQTAQQNLGTAANINPPPASSPAYLTEGWRNNSRNNSNQSKTSPATVVVNVNAPHNGGAQGVPAQTDHLNNDQGMQQQYPVLQNGFAQQYQPQQPVNGSVPVTYFDQNGNPVHLQDSAGNIVMSAEQTQVPQQQNGWNQPNDQNHSQQGTSFGPITDYQTAPQANSNDGGNGWPDTGESQPSQTQDNWDQNFNANTQQQENGSSSWDATSAPQGNVDQVSPPGQAQTNDTWGNGSGSDWPNDNKSPEVAAPKDDWATSNNENNASTGDAWGTSSTENNNASNNDGAWENSSPSGATSGGWNNDNDNINRSNDNQNTSKSGWDDNEASGPTSTNQTSKANLWTAEDTVHPVDATTTASTVPGQGVFVSPYNLQEVASRPKEPPLYTIPAELASEKAITHQVQPGEGFPYLRPNDTPEYKDTLNQPYARFIFKYRVPEAIESRFGITVDKAEMLRQERNRLKTFSKEELIDVVLGQANNKPPSPKPEVPRTPSVINNNVTVWPMNFLDYADSPPIRMTPDLAAVFETLSKPKTEAQKWKELQERFATPTFTEKETEHCADRPTAEDGCAPLAAMTPQTETEEPTAWVQDTGNQNSGGDWTTTEQVGEAGGESAWPDSQDNDQSAQTQVSNGEWAGQAPENSNSGGWESNIESTNGAQTQDNTYQAPSFSQPGENPDISDSWRQPPKYGTGAAPEQDGGQAGYETQQQQPVQYVYSPVQNQQSFATDQNENYSQQFSQPMPEPQPQQSEGEHQQDFLANHQAGPSEWQTYGNTESQAQAQVEGFPQHGSFADYRAGIGNWQVYNGDETQAQVQTQQDQVYQGGEQPVQGWVDDQAQVGRVVELQDGNDQTNAFEPQQEQDWNSNANQGTVADDTWGTGNAGNNGDSW